MPLIVKPNWRKMQAFRDSPSEGSFARRRLPAAASPILWRRLFVMGLIALGLMLLPVFAVQLRPL